MFAVGTKVIELSRTALDEEERRCLSLLRSCFAATHLEKTILESLPEVDEIAPPLLPPGWEQRLDLTNATIFYVDHST